MMLSPPKESKKQLSPKRNGLGKSSKHTRKAPTTSRKGVVGGVTTLSYPRLSGPIDPIPHLKSLKDSTSSLAAVQKSCFHLNQYAGTDSDSTTQDVPGPLHSSILHDPSFAENTSTVLSALQTCIRNHDDRQCRILACKTLARVGRSAYARIRHSPLLFSMRDGTLSRIEDEVGTDVAVTLANVALEDDDDEVSTGALEALGMLTLSSVSTVGSIAEDELLREIEAIVQARPSTYAPSIVALSDEDIAVAQSELQKRVYENTIIPRLFRLITRVTCYESSHQYAKTLPFLTACLIHAIKTNPATTVGLDRTSYAKRWMEFDAVGMVHEVVYNILLPTLQSALDCQSSYIAAMSSIRLAHACPNAPWLQEVCQLAVVVLAEQLKVSQVAPALKSHTAAALLVALRALVVSERVAYLEHIMENVRSLPSTTVVTSGSSSPGILEESKGSKFYHRPARIGFFTEIALSLFVDGPVDFDVPRARSKAVGFFFMSPVVNSILASRSNMSKTKKKTKSGKNDLSNGVGNKDCSMSTEAFVETHIGEELVLAFCMVASEMGRCVMIPNNEGSSPRKSPGIEKELKEWLRCSLSVLSASSSCLNWRSHGKKGGSADEDGDPQTMFTTKFAAQIAYLRLFQECLYTAGLIAPGSSVSFNLMSRASPIGALLLEELGEATSYMLNFLPAPRLHFALEHLITLADQFLEYKLPEGLPSRHLRIMLLSLLSDHWVQQLCSAALPTNTGSNGSNASHGSSNLNVLNARGILANLSAEITALTETILKDSGNDGLNTSSTNHKLQPYLLICVACVENIALAACECKRRYGGVQPPASSPDGGQDPLIQDVVEDSDYLVSLATSALRGKQVRDDDLGSLDTLQGDDDDGDEGHMLPASAAAVNRIESTVEDDAAVEDDASWGVVGQPSLFSVLVMGTEIVGWQDSNATLAHKRLERTPLISKSGEDSSVTLGTGSAYRKGFMAQWCRQAVLSRIDVSIMSSSFAGRFGDTFGGLEQGSRIRVRPRNWLRLSPPPLPAPRFVHKVVNVGTRLCWGGSTATVSGCSDPISMTVAHAVRRYPQSDGETEHKLTVAIRVYNITPVEIPRGVHMTLRVLHDNMVKRDSLSEDVIEAMGTITEELTDADARGDDLDQLITPSTVTYKQEVKSGEYLTWELALDRVPTKGAIILHPSVTFREMEKDQFSAELVGPAYTFGGEKASGDTTGDNGEEDDFAAADDFDQHETEEYEDVTLDGRQVALSPLVVLQPCPLVFFRDGCGDTNAFRFLWFNMPYRLPSRILSGNESSSVETFAEIDELGQAVARLSLLHELGDNMKGWAFMTLWSKRVFCVLSGDDLNISHKATAATRKCTLEVRGDDRNLLLSLFGSRSARAAVVSALTCDAWHCEELEIL